MTVDRVDVADASATYPCPCCQHRTLDRRSRYRVCAVCLWEDDGQGDHDADVVRDGSNGVSLNQARFNYLEFGAYDQQSVPFARRPMPDERLST